MHGAQLAQSFLAAADAWLCDNFALDIRYIALQRGTGKEIVDATVSLWPMASPRDLNFSVSAASLCAGQSQVYPVPKHRALEILQSAITGRLEAEGDSFELAGLDDLDYYSEMTHRDRWFSPLHLRVSARRSSAPTTQSTAEIETALRKADYPFDGLADLSGWLGLNADLGGSRAPAITIAVAPPVDLIFNESRLSEDTLSATLHAHPNLDTSRVTFSLRGYPNDGLSTRRQAAALIEWSEADQGRRVGRLSAPMPAADSVLTMLILGNETVRRQWIADPKKAQNERLLAVAQFDPELRKVRQALFESPESRKFEQGVAMLFHLLGYSSVLPLETESPDLLVHSPGGRLLLVECTTRLADFATKSGKLVERRVALTKAMSASNVSRPIHSVLVCRLPRDEIAAAPSELQERQVFLLAREALESLLLRLRTQFDPDAHLAELLDARAPGGHAL